MHDKPMTSFVDSRCSFSLMRQQNTLPCPAHAWKNKDFPHMHVPFTQHVMIVICKPST